MMDEERARELNKQLGRDRMLRQNDPVMTLVAALAAVREEERRSCEAIARECCPSDDNYLDNPLGYDMATYIADAIAARAV